MRARKTTARGRFRDGGSYDPALSDSARELMLDRARAAYIDGDEDLEVMETKIAEILARPRARTLSGDSFYTGSRPRTTKRRRTVRK